MFNLLFTLSFSFNFQFLDFLGFCRWRKKYRNQLRLNITSVNWDTIKGPIKALIRPTTFAYGFVFCIVMIHYPPLIYFSDVFKTDWNHISWIVNWLLSYCTSRRLWSFLGLMGYGSYGFMELGFGIFEIMRAGNKSFTAWYLYIDLPKPTLGIPQTIPSDPFQITRISLLR